MLWELVLFGCIAVVLYDASVFDIEKRLVNYFTIGLLAFFVVIGFFVLNNSLVNVLFSGFFFFCVFVIPSLFSFGVGDLVVLVELGFLFNSFESGIVFMLCVAVGGIAWLLVYAHRYDVDIVPGKDFSFPFIPAILFGFVFWVVWWVVF